jgi:hypothetical protein
MIPFAPVVLTLVHKMAPALRLMIQTEENE